MKKISLADWCGIITVITAMTGTTQILGMMNKMYDMGKDNTDFLKYHILVEGIQAWGIIGCCALFFILASNARKGKVFVPNNEKILMIFGGFVLLTGIFAGVLAEIFSINKEYKSTTTMLLISGFSFVFFSLILKIGRDLKKEQDLTI